MYVIETVVEVAVALFVSILLVVGAALLTVKIISKTEQTIEIKEVQKVTINEQNCVVFVDKPSNQYYLSCPNGIVKLEK